MKRHKGRPRPFASTSYYVPFHAAIYWRRMFGRGLNLTRNAKTVVSQ